MRVSPRRAAALAASLTLGLGAAFGFAACGDDEDDEASVEETVTDKSEDSGSDDGGGGLGY